MRLLVILSLATSFAVSCISADPEGLRASEDAPTTVAFDWYDKPLPTIPLPNDIATRYDATSATRRRLNASRIAPTFMEASTRTLFDELDGWGVFAPITIPFTDQIDVASLRDAHCDFAPEDTGRISCRFETDRSDDVIYLIDVDPRSPDRGKVHPLDIGNGNFPVVVEDIDGYWSHDPRGWTQSILFEEADEDLNDNGVMDPGEDTDLDGVLDRPNYLPGHTPARDDLRGRADALMAFYDYETKTVIARSIYPLREQTTYAVVVTNRLLDVNGHPVGSPFDAINHTSQTKALADLPELLPAGTTLDDVAFAWTFTTGSLEANWKVVRDGLYGHGLQKHIGEQFPAEVAELFVIRPGADKPYLVYSEEWRDALELIQVAFFGGDSSSRLTEDLLAANDYIDYHVIGTIRSPQLFEREDADGNPLPLNAQSWPNDLQTRAVTTRSEDVHFWLMVPRKEVSARGEGKPTPVGVHMHGYGSQRFEALTFAGYFAKHGVATLTIDAVSHGMELNDEEYKLASTILGNLELGDFFDAVLTDRAFDQNNDGRKDSGADFWTAYLFHTRDVIRQSALDYMQLIRVLQSFDGTRKWRFDTDGDGTPDLAGDFDGDGLVDIGKGSPLTCVGASLGGIMASVVGGIEPHVDAIVPIAGGGNLSGAGIRTKQGGVREAIVLRIMGPVYIGTLTDGALAVSTIVPDLTDDPTLPLGTLADARVGDTLIVRNLDRDTVGCGLIDDHGHVRAHVESDLGDRTEIELYRGLAVVNGSGECDLIEGMSPVSRLDTLQHEIVFQEQVFAEGDTLRAFAEGMGRYRGRPGLRRMMQLAQVALDPGDPAVYAPFFQERSITYPGTGETTGAHALVVNSVGDMNVPVSGGAHIARTAGYIDIEQVDPRYGKTPNQVLIDTGTLEAVHTISRYHMPDGAPTHIDIEDFAEGTDLWGTDVPRLDPPLRLVAEDKLCDGDAGCGISGVIFPFPKPKGEHGFEFPGGLTDLSIEKCEDECAEGADCDCDRDWFDIGHYAFNVLGRYIATSGHEIRFDLCQSNQTCAELPARPPQRDRSTLR